MARQRIKKTKNILINFDIVIIINLIFPAVVFLRINYKIKLPKIMENC